MINQDIEIWTFNGWETPGNIIVGDKVMIFNLKTRKASFKEIKKIDTVIYNNNIAFGNNNYSFVVNKSNTFLNDEYKIFTAKDLLKKQIKILMDARTFFIPTFTKETKEYVKFYTFDLQENEFVYVKSGISFYLGWKILDK